MGIRIPTPVASATGAATTPLCGVRGDVGIAPYEKSHRKTVRRGEAEPLPYG